MRSGPLEITDLLWRFAPDGSRQPIEQSVVVGELLSRGQARAARIVTRIPAPRGILDPVQVDALALRVHCELQRLEEELQFGRRVAAT